jgi:hypothetical protein
MGVAFGKSGTGLDRESMDGGYMKVRDPLQRACALKGVENGSQCAKGRSQLPSSEIGPEAEVCTKATEGQMMVGCACNVECVGVLEDRFVSIG